MHRRSIVLLAGGLFALALAPPVFGAGESPDPPPDQAYPTTSSTAAADSTDPGTDPSDPGTDPSDPGTDPSDPGTDPSDPGNDPSDPGNDPSDPGTDPSDPGTDPAAGADACNTPETVHEPAPAEGESVVFPAGEAGEVEVARASATELEIVDAVANDGWTAEVMTATGPRVKVRFVNDTDPSAKTRFAAQMDEQGEEIHVRVTNCS